MIFKKGYVYCDDYLFHKIDLEINKERIVAMGDFSDKVEKEEELMDFYVIPGLIDIHIHGCVNADFSDGILDGLNKIAKYLAKNGITSFCPTSLTLSAEQLRKVFQIAYRFKKQNKKEISYIHGITMEGPFISADKKGAQPIEHIKLPDIDLFKKLNEDARGMIKIVGIAPETKGSIDFIKQIKKTAIVALAHTNSDYETAKKAINNGATHIIHLFNAMPPLHHRKPGVIGAAIENKKVSVELICDGIHVHKSLIKAAFKLFTDDRIVFISDSIRSCGLNNGEYNLGGQKVYVKGRKATLADGTIAGSSTNLFDCMKIAFKMGIKREDVIKCSTINPAKVIGVSKYTGSITVGKYADLVICDKEFNISRVYIKGKRVF